MTRYRVVVADNDRGVREALADVLAADPRFEVVGQVATGHELPALLDRCRPPVVVGVSAETQVATVVAMLHAGAVGFLAKGWIGHTLPEAVARCAEGQVVLAVPNGAQVLRALRGVPPDLGRPRLPADLLTP